MYVLTKHALKMKQGYAYTRDKNDQTQNNGFWYQEFCGRKNSKCKQYLYQLTWCTK